MPKLKKLLVKTFKKQNKGSINVRSTIDSAIGRVPLNDTIQQVVKVGIQPIIMTSPTIRMYVKQIVERINDDIPVISFNELESDVEVQNIGVVHFQDVEWLLHEN